MKIETVEKTEKHHSVRMTDDEGNVTEIRCKSKAHARNLAKAMCEALVEPEPAAAPEEPNKAKGEQP